MRVSLYRSSKLYYSPKSAFVAQISHSLSHCGIDCPTHTVGRGYPITTNRLAPEISTRICLWKYKYFFSILPGPQSVNPTTMGAQKGKSSTPAIVSLISGGVAGGVSQETPRVPGFISQEHRKTVHHSDTSHCFFIT
jgi:hypothetical protein